MEQVRINGKLLFDLWHNGRWIGMAEGTSPEDARRQIVSAGIVNGDKLIMLPYYGRKTSVQTYTALTGQQPVSFP